MAFPNYGIIYKWSEKPGINPVLRSQFERGPVKQVKILSKQPIDLQVQYVCTAAEAATFETWYESINRGADYFDMEHPLTGSTISARIKDGQYSKQPFSIRQNYVLYNFVVEYYR